jgi:hypothetical protein
MDTASSNGDPGALVATLGRWWRQGLRTAFFRAPDWNGLHATPAVLATLFIAPWLFSIAIERLYILGPATFYWPALYLGWLSTAVAMCACWLLGQATANPGTDAQEPSGAQWFGMLSAQTTTFIVVLSSFFVPLVHADALPKQGIWASSYLLVWIAPMLWIAFAEILLVLRSKAAIEVVLASILLVGVGVFTQIYRPPPAWYASPTASDDVERKRLQITQDVWELQPTLLATQLQELEAERPGVVDVYAITFAPDASEDVFRNESDLVADVLERRFDSAGHTLQLVNHLDTIRERPWATITNLQRAIRRAAELMNRDEDILFVHLASHGGRDGRFIAASNLRDGAWARNPVFVLGPSAVLVVGLEMFPRYFRRMADRVEDQGTYLLARHRGVEARIELQDIMNVTFVARSIPQKVVLRLATPSALGSGDRIHPEGPLRPHPRCEPPAGRTADEARRRGA